jgi:NAD(P)-dependent dehydrogenase (short-subunit alcohol dehydrogenase family)
MELGLAERVAVVTGATSGIGLAAARRFLAEGAAVAFCARDAARVDDVAASLRREFGDRVLGVAANIVDAAAIDAFRDRVAERFGRADVLVHNAGASLMAPFDATDDAKWEAELELKFFGFIRPTRAFTPLLTASDAGSVVYVSSLLARQPETRLAATSAARAGTLNLVKTLSFELAAKGVRLNTVLLGVIDSGQWERRYHERVGRGETLTRERYREELAAERGIPLGRIGTPEEVAAAIAFLACPLSAFTTGAVLEISGGFSKFV